MNFLYDLTHLRSLMKRLEGIYELPIMEEDIESFALVCNRMNQLLYKIDAEVLDKELLDMREEFKKASNGKEEKRVIYKIFNHRRTR